MRAATATTEDFSNHGKASQWLNGLHWRCLTFELTGPLRRAAKGPE